MVSRTRISTEEENRYSKE